MKLCEKKEIKEILKLGKVVVTIGAKESLNMNDVQVALMKHKMHNWVTFVRKTGS